MTPAETVLTRLNGSRRNGTGWIARCPAHEDRVASLSISEGDDGRALVHCHAGCELEDVLVALDLKLADLFAGNADKPKSEIADTYDYTDENNNLLYQVVRFEPKDFRQRRPNGNGGWFWKLGTVRRVPYRLPQVLEAAAAGEWVVIVEGEQDVHTLERFGIVATTNAQGAGKWRPEFAAYLKGARVAVIPDNDEPGRKHADLIVDSLEGIAAKVVQVVQPCREAGGDISDWLDTQDDQEAAAAELMSLITREPISLSAVAQAPPTETNGDVAQVIPITGPRATVPGPQATEDGAALLGDVAAYIRRYCHIGNHYLTVVVTFVAHCHGIDAFYTTPRIKVGSAEADCGKTVLVVDVMGPLLPADPILSTSISPAALFRTLGDRTPTIVLDELDNTLGRKGAGDSESLALLLAILNSGYRRGMSVQRCIPPKQEVVSFPTFAPVVTAGIRSKVSQPYETRCIQIEMQRPLPGEYPEPFEWTKENIAEAHRLRDRIAAWADTHIEDLRNVRPERPPGIVGRKAEVWGPLLTVAEVAGGAWPERVRAAATTLGLGVDTDTQATSHELLADTYDVFGGRDRIFTADLLDGLNALEERPWHTWNDGKGIRPVDFSRRVVQHYKLHRSKSIEVGDRNAKGYLRAWFEDAWARFLDPDGPPGPSPDPSTRQVRQTPSAAREPGDSLPVRSREADPPETLQARGSDGLTGKDPDPGVREAEGDPEEEGEERAADLARSYAADRDGVLDPDAGAIDQLVDRFDAIVVDEVPA